MKRPDLIILISVWMFLCALVVLIPIFAMSTMFFFPMHGMWGWGWDMWDMPWISGIALFGIGIVTFFLVAYLVFSLLGGIWLLEGRERGRILAIIHAALSLLWFPIGTVIGALILVYLTGPRVKDYFQAGGGSSVSS